MNRFDYSQVWPLYLSAYTSIKAGDVITSKEDKPDWKVIENNQEERWFSYEELRQLDEAKTIK